MANVLVRKSTFSIDLPPRSRLYSLAPIGVGTPMVEGLTSYINRLAWSYRISSRILVAEEIIPRLSRSYYFQSSQWGISTFCHREAMSINSFGETPNDWSATIEGLTQQAGLHKLTLGEWASGIPSRRLLRAAPAWCPTCYYEWREGKPPIYQPLLWMLQPVTICIRHRRRLEERCPYCQKHQSVFPSKTQMGYCTQCSAWLGALTETAVELEIDEDTYGWQLWVMDTIGELRAVSTSSGVISWERISVNLAASFAKREGARFSRQMGVSVQLISQWRNFQSTPSLEKVLEVCYALKISPLQLMIDDSASVRKIILATGEDKPRKTRQHTLQRVDREYIKEYLHSVLDGQEPCRGIYQVERHLGIGYKTLKKCFPLECSLISAQYKAQRAQQWKQHIVQMCNEVRRVTRELHAQGIYPSLKQVEALLSKPNMMRKPEYRAAWHAARREMGLEE